MDNWHACQEQPLVLVLEARPASHQVMAAIMPSPCGPLAPPSTAACEAPSCLGLFSFIFLQDQLYTQLTTTVICETPRPCAPTSTPANSVPSNSTPPQTLGHATRTQLISRPVGTTLTPAKSQITLRTPMTKAQSGSTIAVPKRRSLNAWKLWKMRAC